jgi:putative tricarboxylic transport membrane protein
LAVSAVVIYQSIFVLRIFDARQPGSGFMPLGLGMLLGILSCLLIVQHRGRDETRKALWEGSAWVRPLGAIVITAAYGMAFERLGAILSVVVFVLAWLLILERKSILVAVVTGVLTGIVVYFLFEVGLQAPFPKGVLFGG